MEISLLLQGIVNGVMLGLFYALIAVGLSLIFGILGVVNFAHGEMYMFGGFIAYFFLGKFGVNFVVTILASMFIVGLIGVALEKVIFRPLTARPQMELTSLIAAVGLAWIFQMLAVIIFGELDKHVPSSFKGIINLWGAIFTLERLSVIIIGFIVILMLNLFLLRSKIGKAIRAVAQNKEGAALQGIKVNLITALAFGIGCGLAGVAGVLMAPIFGINPFVGNEVILKAFLVVILGGMGSIPGALMGGLVLGFIESFGYLFFQVHTVSVISFVIILFILIFRPQGILGRA